MPTKQTSPLIFNWNHCLQLLKLLRYAAHYSIKLKRFLNNHSTIDIVSLKQHCIGAATNSGIRAVWQYWHTIFSCVAPEMYFKVIYFTLSWLIFFLPLFDRYRYKSFKYDVSASTEIKITWSKEFKYQYITRNLI